jgi:hypothetical protein
MPLCESPKNVKFEFWKRDKLLLGRIDGAIQVRSNVDPTKIMTTKKAIWSIVKECREYETVTATSLAGLQCWSPSRNGISS